MHAIRDIAVHTAEIFLGEMRRLRFLKKRTLGFYFSAFWCGRSQRNGGSQSAQETKAKQRFGLCSG